MPHYILAIDQGTTSSRAMVFDEDSQIVGVGQEEFPQYFPKDGWVEHDPEEIWQSVLQVVDRALGSADLRADQIGAIGITNQRETTVVWDRATGASVYPAIVWQDRRTHALCQSLKAAGHEAEVREKTGLLLDPYFSATKVRWILDHVVDGQARAEAGELCFGTIDSFLLWRLTAGQVHRTDATNAARTLLFNILTQDWDDDILALLNIPRSMLPEVLDCSAHFGVTNIPEIAHEIPITGIAGDQQAALVGQCCFNVGMMKSTYGTGCFMILNTGSEPVRSEHQLLTTVAYRLNGVVCYGLEGSIFIAGASVQWLRDALKVIDHASETEAIAASNPDSHGVYVVPAFTGLGAPHWDAEARGGIFGLTRDAGVADIVTATLQSVSYQSQDLLNAMASDGVAPTVVRVDGGMIENDWMAQNLADQLGIEVHRPAVTETTALGAAYLAGLALGVYPSLDAIAEGWQLARCFKRELPAQAAAQRYAGWVDAVARVKSV
ncbi:glycerol kinase GlpK [Pseudomonadales bacterium]|jgi:glycerol kinase|nr:glycerol kinase GlpK [Gammaproteobacteria bacterium]MDA7591818.1 glycerol kinase GlpK [Pseudomonadales bacterium]MDA8627665.1 glycerol kinase GlpK [Pseudomonadales bacterium]MDA8949516.1 glycerol kinase GlpK [Pseudomonadales bacterium]HAF38310.1 glycerol kinase [Gammaproteobacteria bacterium]